MDVTFLQDIIENDYKLPPGHTVAELTPKLVSNLASTQSDVRETSYMVLSGLVSAGTGVNYSPKQLREIGNQMAQNLTQGIGEVESDSVFVRAFSILVLDKVIAVDGINHYLTESEIRDWLEQGLGYLEAEQDLRGYVPEKGWAHAIAHTALCAIIKRDNSTLGNRVELKGNGVNKHVSRKASTKILKRP